MKSITRNMSLAALVLGTAALSACGGGSGAAGSGALSVNLIDAPVDGATSVVVDFTGIELHNTNGTMVNITFSTAKQIDLLKLQGTNTGALTQGASVPAGTYDWMRLDVLANKDTQGQSYITFSSSGTMYPLYIPSGSETGLKLVSGFTVAQGSQTSFLIEFDLRKSVTQQDGSNYKLVPALRVINQLQVGTITANIDLAALTSQQLGSSASVASCSGGLYLFSGATATPDDADGDTTDDGGSDPVFYEPITYDGTNTQVSVSIPYVATGSYTLAAMCNYNVDTSPAVNDYVPNAQSGQPGYQTMKWTVQDNVSVTGGTTTTVALPSGTTTFVP
ncbi:MAG: DUF4382 domain-containing protein [Gammaproteobacteria bacterium]|nr:DUF4382 domain-containing protein [Gammaproteobacteria bacterium]